jgi:hypothetical protein
MLPAEELQKKGRSRRHALRGKTPNVFLGKDNPP